MAREWKTLAGCAALAMATAGCGGQQRSDGTEDIFAEPEREAGDVLCDLTGTYETTAECERFSDQYARLDAGIDAFEPNQRMTADVPTVVRYSIVRLDDRVQGGGGEIARPAPPPPPPPPPTSPPLPPDAAPGPSSEPGPTPAPPPDVTLSPVPSATFRPRPELVLGDRPIVIASPDQGIDRGLSDAAAERIVIPGSWENRAEAIAGSTPGEDMLSAEPPAPLPSVTPSGVTQEEIDTAVDRAEDQATRNIGAPTGGTTETGQVKVGTVMYACLEADPSFKVEPADCQPMNTREDPDPVWRWTVTPSEPGTSQLKLRSGIVVEASDGGLRKIGQPSRTATIEVDVTTLGAVKRFFASVEEWLKSPIGALGALAALLIAVGGVRRAWKKMNSDEEPPTGPVPIRDGDAPPG